MFRKVAIMIGGAALLVALAACGSMAEQATQAQESTAGQASDPATQEAAPARPPRVMSGTGSSGDASPAPTAVPEAASSAVAMSEPAQQDSAPASAAAEAGQLLGGPADAPAHSGVVVKGQPVPLEGGGVRGQGEGFNSIGGTDTVNDAPYDLTFFKHYGVNPFIDTEDDNLSTFAIDVDTASYTVARRFIQDGFLPEPDSVRVEEFINYFEQDYESPQGDDAFAIHVEGAPSPFGNDRHWLVRVGLQGRTVDADARKDATLIFAIDVSGSMARENRLGLVKRSLRLLVDEMRPTDEIGIVVYGDRGRVLLRPTDGEEKHEIMAAIDRLQPGGSTYVEDGLRLAYGMAAKRVEDGRITRVMLLSDGVGNVGRTGAESILREIQDEVDAGVTLTTVGFGMGNFNDVLMERLANDGNGAYYYVDSLTEARRVFVDDLVGTIQNIAKDTKVQVDFNPQVVRSFRLLGYENRDVADEDFRDDTVDAGEVGAGHSVTALYEVKLQEQAEGTLATVYLRYEDPDTGVVHEISESFDGSDLEGDFQEASARFQLDAVVAEYAEILRESFWAQEGSLMTVSNEARRVLQLLPQDTDVVEFASLASTAAEIWEAREQ